MSPTELLLLTILGAIVFLDDWPFLQSAISRPLVVGPLVGVIVGRPAEGAVWGAVFEAAYLRGLPVGAARLPVAGLAALVGTSVALSAPESELVPAGWVFASGVVAGLAGEAVGRLQRTWNVRTAARARARIVAGDPSGPGRAVASALARAAGLGAAVTLVLIVGASGFLVLVGDRVWLAPLPLTTVAVAGAAILLINGVRLFVNGRMRLAVWGGGSVLGLGVAALAAL